MKLFAGLFFPGLSLVLLSCCCRVQSDDPAGSPVPTASKGTNHTSTTPKPGTIIAVTAQNSTQSTVSPAVPSKTTASNTTTAPTTATNISTTTAHTLTAKTNTTKVPPTSPKSPDVTVVTTKAPSSASTTAVTATAKAPANISRSSGFDVGSFIGGIVLTLGLLIIGYIGCRTYHAKRGVQYRTIDEHDAII